jgi:hypothetical protein
MKHQPPYQPINYLELERTFARPDVDRIAWGEALDCLKHPDLGPLRITDILSCTDLSFDLYLMMVCERALICHGARFDPTGTSEMLEHLFYHGCAWFRHSVLYCLFHIVKYLPEVEDSMLERFDALAFDFFRSGNWRLSTDCGQYMLAGNVANADVVAAHHRPGRVPRVVPTLLREAIEANNSEQIAALFTAIDGVAVYHNNGTLALTMLEDAIDAGGATIIPRVIVSLANVRMLNQPAVDKFIERHNAFAGIDATRIAAAEPSFGEEDLVTLMDGFIVHTILTSDDFHTRICGAFERAASVHDVREFFAQILVWIRDDLAATQ